MREGTGVLRVVRGEAGRAGVSVRGYREGRRE